MSADKPRRLGKGLEALISSAASNTAATPGSDLSRIPIARIRANPYQPRREFKKEELADLQASLKASGLLQPISVRRQGDAYELIAGERRLRAATNLGWTEIPAIIRDFDEQSMLVLALVENLQRSDLNAIEEAKGYKRLVDDFSLTQQQVADVVGKDRTTVTNLLRVLSLPSEVQEMVEGGRLSAGHARALLALSAPQSVLTLADEAANAGMSVRELERRVRELETGSPEPTPTNRPRDVSRPEATKTVDPAIRRIEDDLRRYFQTDARLTVGVDTKGKIELMFYSNDDLERLLDLILRETRRDF